MKQSLQNKIFKKFSYMFRYRNTDISQHCIARGIETGDGWFQLIMDLCAALQKELKKDETVRREFSIEQVKEKFGILRIYSNGGNDKIQNIIESYKNISGKVCEGCGQKGKHHDIDGWLMTLCTKCKKELNKSKV